MTTLDDVPARSWSPADEVELDVRDDLRQGREPFSRIMAAVKALAPGQVLHLRAIFEPLPLYRVLAQRGYSAVSQAHAPDEWVAVEELNAARDLFVEMFRGTC